MHQEINIKHFISIILEEDGSLYGQMGHIYVEKKKTIEKAGDFKHCTLTETNLKYQVSFETFGLEHLEEDRIVIYHTIANLGTKGFKDPESESKGLKHLEVETTKRSEV